MEETIVKAPNGSSGVETPEHPEYKVKEVNVTNQVTKYVADLSCSAFFICLSLFMSYTAYTSEYTGNVGRSGIPAMGFPIVLLGIILILALIQFVTVLKKMKETLSHAKAAGEKIELLPWKSVVMFFMIIAFAFLWSVAGFTVSTFLTFVVVSKFVKPAESWFRILIVSLAFTAGFYICFDMFLRIPFNDPVIQFFRFTVFG